MPKSSNSSVSPVKSGLRSPASVGQLRTDTPKPKLTGLSGRGMVGNSKNINTGKK